MRRYIPLLIIGLCIVFMVLATLLYTTQSVGKKEQANKFIPVTKTLTVYTTIPVEMASIIASEYQKDANIQVNFIPIAKEDLINNFQHNNIKDVDMVLADSTVLEELKSLNALTSNISEEEDIVKERFKDNNNSWIGVWYDPIVFCYNLDYVKNNWQIPLTWNDLAQNNNIKIAMTDFMVASAAANVLYSLSQDKNIDNTMLLMQQIHAKVVRYAKYLSTPVRMVGMGEADVAIAVQSETLRYINDNYPISIIYPKDGTAYQLTAVGIVKDSNQQVEANNFIKWLLGDDIQIKLKKNRYYYVPTNYTSLTYKEFAGKNIRFLEKNNIFDENAKKAILDEWVTNVRLKN